MHGLLEASDYSECPCCTASLCSKAREAEDSCYAFLGGWDAGVEDCPCAPVETS